MSEDVALELESYCEYLLRSHNSALGVPNTLIQMRQLGTLNNLRYVNGLPMIYSITEESIGETLKAIGHGSAVVGRGLFRVGEVLVRGLEGLHAKIVDATANADNVNKKAQLVLAQAKRNGVKMEGEVSIAGGDIQFYSKVDFDSIKRGFISAKEHLPQFITWYRTYYKSVLKDGKSPSSVATFADIRLPGDMAISYRDPSENERDEDRKLLFTKAGGRLKVANKVNVLTLAEIEELTHLVHELAVILRSTQLDTTISQLKDYVKRVKDQEVDSLRQAINNVSCNTLTKIVEHLLDSCITALKYCEHSTY